MKKIVLSIVCTAALTGLAVTASADTLLWTGAQDATNFLAAANWSPAQTPKGGDTLTISKAVTFAACTFDFGEEGLTINNSAKVVSKVAFTGAGRLTKDGTGTLQTDVAGTHTGGTLILNGELYQNVRYKDYPLGTGTIEIRRTADRFPRLNLQNYCTVHSPILVSGPNTANKAAFYENNNPQVYGLVTAEDDFLAYCDWSNGTTWGAGFRGGISAHGHTAYISASGGWATTLCGPIDASLTTSKGFVHIGAGGGTDPAATLTIGAGTCQLKTDGYWLGTNVVLNASDSVLTLNAQSNLAAYAVLTLAEGAKINFATPTAIRVAKVTVNGTELANGSHNVSTDPDLIVGSGALCVGESEEPMPTTLVWTGSAGDTNWNTAANWNPAQVPSAGDFVVFNKGVTLQKGSMDIGKGGLTITVAEKQTVTAPISFSGSGKIQKNGLGTWKANTASTHTGGVDINEGTFGVNANHVAGTGTVTLRAEAGRRPYLKSLAWDKAFTNKVVILGDVTAYDPIIISNLMNFKGLIESESDFSMRTDYGPLCLSGGVSAPGHTLTYKGNSGKNDWDAKISGPFDVSLRLQGPYRHTLLGKGTGLDNALVFAAGTNILDSIFSWEGTNVTASGAKTVVAFNDAKNLSANATLRITDGATVRFDYGSYVTIARLVVDGEELAAGLYTAANLPTVILGSGTIAVGRSVNAWTGGKIGDWSDTDNWSRKRTPTSGEIVYLPGSNTITNRAGEVAIDGDLVVINAAQVFWGVALTGSGRLVKQGVGELRLVGAKLAHTGGIRIEQGLVSMDAKSTIGSGPVWIVRTQSVKPKFSLAPSAPGLVFDNAFHILGPKSTSWDIQVNNDNQFWGDFTAEDDFRIHNCWSNHKYSGTPFHGKVDAPGHTMILTGLGYMFYETTNGSLAPNVTGENWKFTLADGAKGTNPDATFSATGTNVFAATATWAGNLVVNKASDVQLNGAGNLSTSSAVTVTDGGRISIAKGVAVKVASLTVNGVPQPDGVYRKSSSPSGATPGSTFTGDGRLVVGTVGSVILLR